MIEDNNNVDIVLDTWIISNIDRVNIVIIHSRYIVLMVRVMNDSGYRYIVV